jgi:hypothetical protein
VKALSLQQPWLHAVLHLGKRIENRKWNPLARRADAKSTFSFALGLGERFLLHASASVGTLHEFSEACDGISDVIPERAWVAFRDEHLDIKNHKGDAVFIPRASLPRGGIVGVATLRGVLRRGEELAAKQAVLGGEVSEDDLVWWWRAQHGLILHEVRTLPFVPCKGALGFFDVPAEVLAQYDASVLRSERAMVAQTGNSSPGGEQKTAG